MSPLSISDGGTRRRRITKPLCFLAEAQKDESAGSAGANPDAATQAESGSGGALRKGQDNGTHSDGSAGAGTKAGAGGKAGSSQSDHRRQGGSGGNAGSSTKAGGNSSAGGQGEVNFRDLLTNTIMQLIHSMVKNAPATIMPIMQQFFKMVSSVKKVIEE